MDENRPEESEEVINLLKDYKFFVISMPATGIVGPQLKLYGDTIYGFEDIKKYIIEINNIK
ncbi:MAG: hypothetical protein WC549_08820 [Actinomycetota bacterium]